MVEVISALSNQNIEKRLHQVTTLKKWLLEELNPGKPPARQQLKRNQGSIQTTVVEVLRDAGGPLSIPEIRRRLDARVGEPVSRHTVTGFLSNAVRYGRYKVVRVRAGVYALKG